MIRWVASLLAFVAVALSALADEGHHHDQLNEQQLGTVHFPTSCAPTVQKTFERGVALLHSVCMTYPLSPPCVKLAEGITRIAAVVG